MAREVVDAGRGTGHHGAVGRLGRFGPVQCRQYADTRLTHSNAHGDANTNPVSYTNQHGATGFLAADFAVETADTDTDGHQHARVADSDANDDANGHRHARVADSDANANTNGH